MKTKQKRRLKTVPLRVKHENDSRGTCTVKQRTRGPAFFIAETGYLIHRTSRAGDILYSGKPHHEYAHAVCGMQTTSPVFHSDPPRDRLLCERCELLAKLQQLPSAERITGRHVHVGRIFVKQTCCQSYRERN